MKRINKDYFDNKYKLDKKQSLEFANSIVKGDMKRLKKDKLYLISLPVMEAGTSLMFASFAYVTHSVVGLVLASAFGLGTVFVSALTVPGFKANRKELSKIRQKRDDIYNDLMKVYDNNNVKVKRKIRS